MAVEETDLECPYWNKTPHQTIPVYYYLQINLCLECANREWCDFISWWQVVSLSVIVRSKWKLSYLSLDPSDLSRVIPRVKLQLTKRREFGYE